MMNSMRIGRLIFSVCVLALVSQWTNAADFTVKVVDKPAPKEISEPIRAVLQSKAVQLLDGDKPALEIWLRTELPLKSKPAAPNEALNAVPETTLVGAVVVSAADLHDYKNNDIPKGIYTARFALQPSDGDHLGTTEFTTFVALIAADTDKELTGINQFKPMVKASGKLTSSGHPVVVSLRPIAPEGDAPKITEPVPEHKAVRLTVPGKVNGSGDKADVAFELVYRGTGHIQ